jgi:hypothetical protein
VLVETAERLRCPMQGLWQDFLAFEENGRMVYQDEAGLMDLAPPRLPGRHQFANAAAAIAAVKAAGFDISETDANAAMRASNGRAACSGCRKAGCWRSRRRVGSLDRWRPQSGRRALWSPRRWPSRRSAIRARCS